MRAAATAIDLVSLREIMGSAPFIDATELILAGDAGKKLRPIAQHDFVSGRPGRTRSRVHRFPRTCPLCPNHVSGVSASRVPLRSYARLQDFCPAWSRDAPLRHPRLWPATSNPSP